MENNNNSIKSFQDLRVYQNLYQSMLSVHNDIIANLPTEEKYDLVDQMRRASKAAPALIAEGFAKRYQKKNWEKYINDTLGECNEMIHHLSVCIDIYPKFINLKLCNDLISQYDLSCRQLTKLKQSWQDYHRND